MKAIKSTTAIILASFLALAAFTTTTLYTPPAEAAKSAAGKKAKTKKPHKAKKNKAKKGKKAERNKPKTRKIKRVFSNSTPAVIGVSHTLISANKNNATLKVIFYTNAGVDKVSVKYLHKWAMVEIYKEFRTANSKFLGTWSTPSGKVNKFQVIIHPYYKSNAKETFRMGLFEYYLTRRAKTVNGKKIAAYVSPKDRIWSKEGPHPRFKF